MSGVEWVVLGVIALLLVARGHGDIKFSKRCEHAKQQVVSSHIVPKENNS